MRVMKMKIKLLRLSEEKKKTRESVKKKKKNVKELNPWKMNKRRLKINKTGQNLK